MPEWAASPRMGRAFPVVVQFPVPHLRPPAKVRTEREGVPRHIVTNIPGDLTCSPERNSGPDLAGILGLNRCNPHMTPRSSSSGSVPQDGDNERTVRRMGRWES